MAGRPRKPNWYRFAEETYIGGIENAVKAPSSGVQRLWVVVTVACIIGLVTQSYLSLNEFIRGSPVTSLHVETPAGMQLPDILIAQLSRFDAAKLSKYGISSKLGDFIQLGFTTISMQQVNGRSIKETVPTKKLNKLIALQPEYEETLNRLNISDFKELVEALSFECGDIFRDCSAHGFEFDCCEKHNRSIGPQGLGISTRGSVQYLDGTGQGMTIKLSLPTNRYQRGLNLWYADGVVMRLSFGGYPESDYTLLPAASRVHLAIEATHGKYLSTAKNPCDPSPLKPRINCVSECAYNSAFGECDCMPVDSFTNHKEKPTCHPLQALTCVITTAQDIMESRGDELRKACLSECVKPCEEWAYTKTLTSFPLSSAELREHANTSDYSDGAGQTIILDIYYSEVKVTYIEEFRSMGIPDLFGILGGLLGLWLGGSIIGLIHLVLFWTYGGNKDRIVPQ